MVPQPYVFDCRTGNIMTLRGRQFKIVILMNYVQAMHSDILHAAKFAVATLGGQVLAAQPIPVDPSVMLTAAQPCPSTQESVRRTVQIGGTGDGA